MKAITAITTVCTVIIAFAILTPPCTRTRINYKHNVDLNNMRQVALGLTLYAVENSGRYPNSLSELLDPTNGIFPEGMHSEIIFSTLTENPTEVPLSEIDSRSDWIYVRGHSNSSPKDLIVLFSPAGRFSNFSDGEVLVALVGSTVQIMKPEEFILAINRTLTFLHPHANQTVQETGTVPRDD